MPLFVPRLSLLDGCDVELHTRRIRTGYAVISSLGRQVYRCVATLSRHSVFIEVDIRSRSHSS
jgi:hypothetical protein